MDEKSELEEIADAVVDFLHREGSIGMIVKINEENGNIFTELDDKLHVSRNTLSDRIDEAINLDIIKEISDPSDHGNAIRYTLTHRGEKIQYYFDEHHMEELYDDLHRAKREMKRGIEFVEEVYEPQYYDREFFESMQEEESDNE